METTQAVALGIGGFVCVIPSVVFPGTWKVKLGIFLLAALIVAFALWTITLFPVSTYASLYILILPLGPMVLTIWGLLKGGRLARKVGLGLIAAVLLSFSYGALALHLSHASYAWAGMTHLPTFLSGQQAVRDNLNDSESAIFKDLTLRSYHGKRYMCGEVNARNRMVGLVGFTSFYVPLDDAMPFPFFDNDSEHDSFSQYMRTCYGDEWDKDFKK
jgi:hypothetical protein